MRERGVEGAELARYGVGLLGDGEGEEDAVGGDDGFFVA